MSAMPVMIAVLCLMAIAYRYYSAFLAAKVAVLDDSRQTPAYRFNDGQNYHPTSKWVLFGHHFAAISGAGPLIGPVLAAQFGYLPGLLWIVIGVCLAGAVQDFLVLAASLRRQGRSLAQMAFSDVGRITGGMATIAILLIIIVALAGLGKVVVMALAGNAARHIPGSTWGTFTIACTIPIALLVGLWMYKIRPGRNVEASILGGVLTLVATVIGGLVAESRFAPYFNLSAGGITWSMAVYGFVASVLPVWVLLCPRDYLSSFLKIGTIALLVVGTILANPKLEAPAMNHVFWGGGPTVRGQIFPFLFITIMCGAISGFHALVSSGTTPKMVKKESDARTIGYGAMLIEGLVGVVAMIAASTLPVRDYYAMNTELAAMPKYHDQILHIAGPHGVEDIGMYEDLTKESLRGRTGGAVTLAVGMAHIFDGAAQRFTAGAQGALRTMWKYWYHFAIMFEALFILTTIDTGTRIGRFLLQEVAGKIHPSLGVTGGWPSAIVSTALIVAGWAWFMNSDSFATVWATFGIANQVLAVIALAIVSAYLANAGRARYLWVTVLPMLFVMTTTGTAAVEMFNGDITGIATQLQKSAGTRDWSVILNAGVRAGLILAMMICTFAVLISAAARIWTVTNGLRNEAPAPNPPAYEPAVGKVDAQI